MAVMEEYADTEVMATPKITTNEITKCLKYLTLKKSPGPNGITNELLKPMVESKICLEVLATAFNLKLEDGNIPDSWGRLQKRR